MKLTAPHYLLFTEAKDIADSSATGGRWRFVLEKIGSATRIEEAHTEPGVIGERLQLLVVVRGLEALGQPSRITLFTPSRFVGRGIRLHLSHWRDNAWRWESFGGMTTIKHDDLWRRIDDAMQIHQIDCRVWQFDPPHLRTQLPIAESSGDPPIEVQPVGFDNQAVITPVRPQTGNGRKIIRKSRSQDPAEGQAVLIPRIKPVGRGRAFGYATT